MTVALETNTGAVQSTGVQVWNSNVGELRFRFGERASGTADETLVRWCEGLHQWWIVGASWSNSLGQCRATGYGECEKS